MASSHGRESVAPTPRSTVLRERSFLGIVLSSLTRILLLRRTSCAKRLWDRRSCLSCPSDTGPQATERRTSVHRTVYYTPRRLRKGSLFTISITRTENL